ncbi:MAG: hypothetical protein Q4F84_03595 [Fibrobacter sp.]|nr:hypothetical protein [Fibrobacter sp.]
MIVKMKQVTILGLKQHTETLIDQLQTTGLVHITPVTPSQSSSLEHITDKIFLTETALQIIKHKNTIQLKPDNISKTVEQIFKTSETLDTTKDTLGTLELEKVRLSFLENFDPHDIGELEKKGIFIDLYEIPQKKFPSGKIHLHNTICQYIGDSTGNRHVFAIVSYKEKENIGLKKFELPQITLQELQIKIEHSRKEIQRLKAVIDQASHYYMSISSYLEELKSRRDFELVRSGMGENEEIVYLRGFCSINDIAMLENSAKKNRWGILIEDPPKGSVPPTLIQNPRWVQIIDPVFKLLNTIPGYNELDISAVFLIFFSIFFGMLIGDAGYGVIFLAATALVQIKLGKKIRQKSPFFLMYVLSTVTIIWGTITGNWFGIIYLSEVMPFKFFVIQDLNVYKIETQRLFMSISFYIAAIQLSIAHFMVISRNICWSNLLVNIGWIFMIWVMFFIAQNQVLGKSFPWFFVYLAITAIILISVFTFLNRPLQKSIPEILISDILLATINTFADTISYIRLFAVGLATLAVAQSFNEIAISIGFGNILSGLGAALILIAGHALNISLAIMAVIVHGIRLNMLEFSSHVGNTWTGYKYNPFRKKTVT